MSWGWIPGLLLAPKELVLAERISGLFFVGLTIVGLYLTFVRHFGHSTAGLACLVFVLSERAFFFSNSMWPRAHPVFLVWMIYFLDLWVVGRRAWALVATLVIWLASGYWMLEGVTAVAILPLVWIAFRPPVRMRDLLAAVAIGFILWEPYLAFEMGRRFTDLRATLTRTSTITDYDGAYRSSFSNRALQTVEGFRPRKMEAGASPQQAADEPQYHWILDYSESSTPEWIYQAVRESQVDGLPGRWTWTRSTGKWVFWKRGAHGEATGQTISSRLAKYWLLVLASLPQSGAPGGQGILLYLLIASVAWAFLRSPRAWLHVQWPAPVRYSVLICLAGMALIAAYRAAALPATIPERRSLQAFLLLTGAGAAFRLVSRKPIFAPGPNGKTSGKNDESAALRFATASAAFFPWIITIALMLADPGTNLSRRFLWLWVVQGALIVAMLRDLAWPAAIKGLLFLLVIFVVSDNQQMIGNTASWRSLKFHIAPPDDMNQAIDYLGRRIKSEGRTSVKIGYDVAIAQAKWPLLFHSVDGVSKVGLSMDRVLLARYGITNLDTTAEGIEPDDDFRIVEESSVESWRQTYFDLTGYPEMKVAYRNHNFSVLSR